MFGRLLFPGTPTAGGETNSPPGCSMGLGILDWPGLLLAWAVLQSAWECDGGRGSGSWGFYVSITSSTCGTVENVSCETAEGRGYTRG